MVPHDNDNNTGHPINEENSNKWKINLKRERTNISLNQIAVLEEVFRKTTHPTSQIIKEIAQQINLIEPKVTIWFKNRRAKEKKSKGKSPSKLAQQPLFKLPMHLPFHQPALPPVHDVPSPDKDDLEEAFRAFVQTVQNLWSGQNSINNPASILRPQFSIQQTNTSEVHNNSDDEISVISPYTTSNKRSVFKNPIHPLLNENPITIPRFMTIKAPTPPTEQHSNNSDQATDPVIISSPGDEISVIPKPTYKVQEGSLKMVFLGLFKEKDFIIQVLTTCPALSISDTRDSTANCIILKNTNHIKMSRNNMFPVIKVTEWTVQDCTINIINFSVVDTGKLLGNPKPIQESFFNYMKNENVKKKDLIESKIRFKDVNVNVKKDRCNVCKGCKKHACRRGGKKISCRNCLKNDQENCARRKCLGNIMEELNGVGNESLLKEGNGTDKEEENESISLEVKPDNPTNIELPLNDYNIKTEVIDDYPDVEPTLVIDC